LKFNFVARTVYNIAIVEAPSDVVLLLWHTIEVVNMHEMLVESICMVELFNMHEMQVLQKASENNALVEVALNTHGTRAVQKLIETLTSTEQVGESKYVKSRLRWWEDKAAIQNGGLPLYC
jgi:hypothetical protein